MNMLAINIPEISYLIASVLFIVGLKRLSSPATARSGNTVAAVGMAIAVLGTFALPGIGNFGWIIAAIIIGTVPGYWLARVVKMTDMPQMVSLFNGMGGACALFISIAEYIEASHQLGAGGGDWVTAFAIGGPILLGVIFGAVSFTGSIIAFGKLQGIVTEKAVRWPLQKFGNLALVGVMLLGCYCVLAGGSQPGNDLGAAITAGMESGCQSLGIALVIGTTLLLGVLLVLPIGGADMPVVISVLNSCTGMAAAITGFAMHNMSMIIAGTLVGAAGSLLTLLMCHAMNRSLTNVLFGAFGTGGAVGGGGSAGPTDRSVREVNASESAILMGYARKVIIIPGYGLAVAQAQHLIHELDELLEKRGVEVKYAIHPVAGRMPGHMNVLLAEANVPYPKLVDMDEINPEFDQADVALVVGANDVVNPAARSDKSSPIFGMPILDADHAKTVIVMKRGLAHGYAGIENNLFYDPKCRMLLGDAKKMLTELVQEVKAL